MKNLYITDYKAESSLLKNIIGSVTTFTFLTLSGIYWELECPIELLVFMILADSLDYFIKKDNEKFAHDLKAIGYS